MKENDDSIEYLSVADILTIHELIVESNEDTEPGVSSSGDIEYAVEHIREGHFGRIPETIHEKAFQLLRLIAANHPFVDGNKRTALMSVRVFYALNGQKFDYDRTMKEHLKELATDEASVDTDAVLSYFEENTHPLESEYDATIQLWLSRIDMDKTESTSSKADDRSNEPNDYD